VLKFSSKKEEVITVHDGSLEDYFLYSSFNGAPVYQHSSGTKYLYSDGKSTWYLSYAVNTSTSTYRLYGKDEDNYCFYRRFSPL